MLGFIMDSDATVTFKAHCELVGLVVSEAAETLIKYRVFPMSKHGVCVVWTLMANQKVGLTIVEDGLILGAIYGSSGDYFAMTYGE